MALTGTIRGEVRLTHTSVNDLCTATDNPIDVANYLSWTVTDGTGANQADLIWHDQRSIGASSSEDIDLAGVLVDVFGTTLTFARIKMIHIKAKSTNGGNIVVGAGSNPWLTMLNAAGTITLPASAGFMALAPGATAWAVTAGTGDILQVANDDAGAAGIYDIIIVGASA